MLAVHHVPIAMLAIPIPVPVMVPVFMIPVVVFVSTSSLGLRRCVTAYPGRSTFPT
jgi:hypothetical protein